MPSKAKLVDIQRMKDQIKDIWPLYGLFDGTPDTREAECMVDQVFYETLRNQEIYGQAFSSKPPGIHPLVGGGVESNASAYSMLIARKYFIEEDRDHRTVIFITQRLVDLVAGLFAKGPTDAA